jgi:hypothetical protein
MPLAAAGRLRHASAATDRSLPPLILLRRRFSPLRLIVTPPPPRRYARFASQRRFDKRYFDAADVSPIS